MSGIEAAGTAPAGASGGSVRSSTRFWTTPAWSAAIRAATTMTRPTPDRTRVVRAATQCGRPRWIETLDEEGDRHDPEGDGGAVVGRQQDQRRGRGDDGRSITVAQDGRDEDGSDRAAARWRRRVGGRASRPGGRRRPTKRGRRPSGTRPGRAGSSTTAPLGIVRHHGRSAASSIGRPVRTAPARRRSRRPAGDRRCLDRVDVGACARPRSCPAVGRRGRRGTHRRASGRG